MKNKLMLVLAFSLGAAAGAAVSWKVLETKYDKLTRDEIESFKEYWRNRNTEEAESQEDEEIVEEEDEEDTSDLLGEYRDIALNYMAEAEKKVEEAVDMDKVEKPYVVTPNEFGEIYAYETETLLYYRDGILADDDDNIIEDVEGTVGYDSLNHFGEFEDDSVFVRNDRLGVDYEILRSERTYDEVARYNSYLSEDE